jgi:hypothetical protein
MVANESAGLAVIVVLVEVAGVADCTSENVSDPPTSNATTATPEMKRIHNLWVVLSALLTIIDDTKRFSS